MGGNVADYSVVRDSNFTIDVSGPDEVTFNVSFPGALLSEQASILGFAIRNANGMRLRINVNNRTVHEENITNGTEERTLQEVLPSDIWRRGERNTIEFTALQGRGEFSDVVVWFQRST